MHGPILAPDCFYHRQLNEFKIPGFLFRNFLPLFRAANRVAAFGNKYLRSLNNANQSV